MKTSKGLRVSVIVEKDKVVTVADDRWADDITADDNSETLLNSCGEMKEDARLINTTFDGKDRASRRHILPSPHEEFGDVVLDLQCALNRDNILKQMDLGSRTRCLSLIDDADADPGDVRRFIEEMSTFEPDNRCDVIFLVEDNYRQSILEKQCQAAFQTQVESNSDETSKDNDNNNSVLLPTLCCKHGTNSDDLNGKADVTSKVYIPVTSFELNCEMWNSNRVETVTNTKGKCDETTASLNEESVPSVMFKGRKSRTSVDANGCDKTSIVTDDSTVEYVNCRDKVRPTPKEKNDLTLTTGEFEPLLTQEYVPEVKLTVTEQLFSGIRKIAQMVMDSMVSVKTEDEDVQPYGEAS